MCKVQGEAGESFRIYCSLRYETRMCNITLTGSLFMDGDGREMKVRDGNVEVEISTDDTK